MKKNIARGLIEIGFIIFLFYSNLLMGEFERSGLGQKVAGFGALGRLHGLQFGDCGDRGDDWLCSSRISAGQILGPRIRRAASRIYV